MKILFNWLLFIGVIAGVYFGWKYVPRFTLPTLPGYLVILFALSIAFTWVEKLKWGAVKPFNCVPCLTGWFSLFIAVAFHTPFWYFYLFVGLFTGSMYSAVKMRWL